MLRPYGVWAVISPFNFPAALAGGPVSGALLAGNTVVLKPSQETPLTGTALYRIFREAGVPAGALHLVFGTGEDAGEPLALAPGSGRHALHRLEGGRDVAPRGASAASFPSPASPRWAARTPRS